MAKAVKTKIGRVNKTSSNKPDEFKIEYYRCIRCGKEWKVPHRQFYRFVNIDFYRGNNHYSHICKTCCQELYDTYVSKVRNTELACVLCCHHLNIPYDKNAYDLATQSEQAMTFDDYLQHLKIGKRFNNTFSYFLIDNNTFTQDVKLEQKDEGEESNWTLAEKRAKRDVVELLGVDPFSGYSNMDRRFLFVELLKWLDDDELIEDSYKITQVIQIINNNQQIKKYDIALSSLDPLSNSKELSDLNRAKSQLVLSNDKIAKENGISVKNRQNQRAGKGSLTGLMREMREKNLDEAEVNFYNQLQSANSRWAAEVSMRALKENCFFNENDVNDIIDTQRELITRYTNQLDNTSEKLRLSKICEQQLIEHIDNLEKLLINNNISFTTYTDNIQLIDSDDIEVDDNDTA